MRLSELVFGKIEIITPEDIVGDPEHYYGRRRPMRNIETAGYIVDQETKVVEDKMIVAPYGRGHIILPQVEDIFTLSSHYSSVERGSGLTVVHKHIDGETQPQYPAGHIVRVKGKVIPYNDSYALAISREPKLSRRE